MVGSSTRTWKNSTYFLRDAGLRYIFQRALSGSSSVYSCFWKNSAHFLLLAVKIWTLVFPRALRIRQVVLFVVLGSTVDTCCPSPPGAFDGLPIIFFVKGNSDPEVDSRPALLVVFVPRRTEKCAHRCFNLPERIAHQNWALRPRALHIWQFLFRCPGVS